MAMNYPQLAEEMRIAMGFSTTTTQLLGWARGIVEEVKNGIATYGGNAGPHTISNISGPNMASLIQNYAGYSGVSPQLNNYCTAIANYIMVTARVTYIGPLPPAFPDWWQGGTISGMVGSGMANSVAFSVPYPNVSAQLLAQCNVIVSHIHTNAQVVLGVIT